MAPLTNWQPKHAGAAIHTLDCHTGGEPLRIIYEGFPRLAGQTILAMREDCLQHFDHFRTALMFEPRGHADMYGALIVPAERPSSHFGVLFLHNEGYSTMCGHAIIALARVAIESGWVPIQGDRANIKNQNTHAGGITEIRIDTPAGLVKAYVETHASGKIIRTWFINVPAFVQHYQQPLRLSGISEITIDVAFGGAFYVFVDADALQLPLTPAHADRIIALGREIKSACAEQYKLAHPTQPELSFLYGTIFTAKSQSPSTDGRHVCIFADGELDRSPTGTGVSARAAIEFLHRDLALNQTLTLDSILGSPFKVTPTSTQALGELTAVITEVEGSAYVTGKHTFYMDPLDRLNAGFIFR